MHESYQKWLDDAQPKVYCQCSCNDEIIIKNHHKYAGIPKYLSGHNSRGENNSMYGQQTFHISYINWLNNGNPKIFCECGCEEEIIITKNYRYRGIPKYIRGHYIRGCNIPESYQKWLDDVQPKMYCNCGCNGEIIIKDCHKYDGIPKYLLGHYIHGENNPNWKGGISFAPYCEKFNNRKKEEIRNQYNRQCYICGKNEKDNITKTNKIIRLSVHHIDGDKEQGCNGKQWKLIPLCMHCHNSKKWKI